MRLQSIRRFVMNVQSKSNSSDEKKAIQNNRKRILEIIEDKLYFNGKKSFLLTGEFPYYRLDPKKWEHRLDAVGKLGIGVLTFYVPWNFHETEDGKFDFHGKTDPKRDLNRFLSLIYQA